MSGVDGFMRNLKENLEELKGDLRFLEGFVKSMAMKISTIEKMLKYIEEEIGA